MATSYVFKVASVAVGTASLQIARPASMSHGDLVFMAVQVNSGVNIGSIVGTASGQWSRVLAQSIGASAYLWVAGKIINSFGSYTDPATWSVISIVGQAQGVAVGVKGARAIFGQSIGAFIDKFSIRANTTTTLVQNGTASGISTTRASLAILGFAANRLIRTSASFVNPRTSRGSVNLAFTSLASNFTSVSTSARLYVGWTSITSINTNIGSFTWSLGGTTGGHNIGGFLVLFDDIDTDLVVADCTHRHFVGSEASGYWAKPVLSSPGRVWFAGSGSLGYGTGDVTPGLPLGWAENDIFILIVETDRADPPATPAGWDLLFADQGPACTDTGLDAYATIFYRRSTSSETAPTIADPGNHCHAQILSFRGCPTSGTFCDTYASVGDIDDDGANYGPSITTTRANCLVIMGCCNGGWVDHYSFANANLIGVQELCDSGSSSGNSGTVFAAMGGKVTAGATGDTNILFAPSGSVAFHIALYPGILNTALTVQDLTHNNPLGTFALTKSSTLAVNGNVHAQPTGTFALTKNITLTVNGLVHANPLRSPSLRAGVNSFTSDATCVALYRFESGALTDDSKSTNDLTATGSPTVNTTEYVEGGGSVEFLSGDNEYYARTDTDLASNFPFKNGTSNNKITACAWVNFTEFNTDSNAILSKFDTSSNRRSFTFRQSLNASEQKLVILIGYSSGTISEFSAYHAYNLQINTWYHVAFIVDDSTKSYKIQLKDIDGNTLGSDVAGTFTNNVSFTTEPVRIGAQFAGGSVYAPTLHYGMVDEVVIFNRVLSDSEIDQIALGRYNHPLLVVSDITHSQAPGSVVLEYTDTVDTELTVQGLEHTQFTYTGVNLLSNGSFETDTAGWTETNCTIASVGDGVSGNCLEITSTAGTLQTVYQTISSSISSGRSYRAACWVKSGTSGDDLFWLDIYNEGISGAIAYFEGTSSPEWRRCFFEFTVTPAHTPGTYLLVAKVTDHSVSPGTMLFDEVSLHLIDIPLTQQSPTIELTVQDLWHRVHGGNILQNAYFSEDLSNWSENPDTDMTMSLSPNGERGNCMSLSVDSGVGAAGAQQVGFALTIGKTYNFGVSIKAGTAGAITASVALYEAGVSIRDAVGGTATSSWQVISKQYTLVDPVNQFYIWFGGALGTTLFDSPFIEEVPTLIQHYSLVVQSCVHAQPCDSVALTGAATLSVLDDVHAQPLGSSSLTQVHSLVVNGLVHSVISDSPALTSAATLVVQGTVHSVISENVTLTQVHALVSSGTVHSLISDNVLNIQNHALTVNGLIHSLISEQAVLASAATLIAQDCVHGQPIDQPVLTVAGALSVLDVTHAQPLDSAVLTQVHVLSRQDTTHALISDATTIVQQYTAVVQGTVHAISSEQVALTSVHALTTQGITHAQITGSLALTQAHVLSALGTVHAIISDNPDLSGAAQIVVQGAVHGHLLDNVALTQVHALITQGTVHGQYTGTFVLTQNHRLTAFDDVHSQPLDVVSLSGAAQLIVQELLHGHPTGTFSLNQNHALVCNDIIHAQSPDTVSMGVASSLVAQDGVHAQPLGATSLTQAHSLSVSSTLHAEISNNVTLVLAGLLVVADVVHANLTGDTSLTQVHALSVLGTVHALPTDNVTNSYNLVLQECRHTLVSEHVALTSVHSLVVSSTLHAITSDDAQLRQQHALSVAHGVHAHYLDSLSLSSIAALVVLDVLHSQRLDFVALTQYPSVKDGVIQLSSTEPTLFQAQTLVVQGILHQHILDLENIYETEASQIGNVWYTAIQTCSIIREILSITPKQTVEVREDIREMESSTPNRIIQYAADIMNLERRR